VSGILYLSEADTEQCRPSPLEAIDLARAALTALADGRAQLPPKLAVHPRPGCFANAMPAYVTDGDLLGLKWVAIYHTNPGRGLPLINGVVVVCDSDTGLPRAVLGAGYITGIRTAAVSGACMQALAPAGASRVAITGAGLQARTHLETCAALGYENVVVYARRSEAGQQLQAWASAYTPSVQLGITNRLDQAIADAHIIITAVPIGAQNAIVDERLIRPDALLLPLDWATSIPARVANDAHLYADDVDQYHRLRDNGVFPDWRAADGYVGAALRAARPEGRVVAQNPGQGAADLLFADRIIDTALRRGIGVTLPR
jgi:ornithine cyclodeaminase/alanine dehydrogenase-like protein (mu-crystallin family)